MMLGLLIYGYVTGRFSSRDIDSATYSDVAMRYLAANTHPEFSTICEFRRENQGFIQAAFTQVLVLARELGVLKMGTVSIDGTKVLANASKHKAVSYQRAGEQIELLEKEVVELLRKGEEADSTPLADGLTVEGEVALRSKRLAKLQEARRVIEERVAAEAEQKRIVYEEKLAQWEQKKAQKKRRGKEPKAPTDTPTGSEQYNFTDEQSRIMKAGNGGHFGQCYNAQAGVEVESRLIVGERVCTAANDFQQLVPTADQVSKNLGCLPENVLVDSGFYSHQAVATVEKENPQSTVYAAMSREEHHRTLADLAPTQEPPPCAPDASPADQMRHRMSTPKAKNLYRLRKQTVEPVFGIIKEAMSFRRFSLRGLPKVSLEWSLVCLSYNLRRLFNLQPG
jgi:hypothetical protein